MNIVDLFNPRHARQISMSLIRDFKAGRCFDNSAILTMTTLLSLVPLITLIYAALRLMPGMNEVGGEVESWIFDQLVPSRSDEIRGALQQFSNQASKLTIAGSTVLLITSLLMLARIEVCLNAIWQVKPAISGLRAFLRYWAVLSLGPILIGVGVFLTSYVTSIKIVGSAVELLGVKAAFLSIFPFLLTIGAFTLVYTAVPNAKVPPKAAMLGALIAASLFETTKRVFAWFITEFPSYELIYGAFAALPIFIVWLNLCWLILLLGGVVSRTFAVDVLRTTKVEDLYAGLEVLRLFGEAQKNGEILQEGQVLKQSNWLSRYQWDRLRELFETQGLFVRTESDGFVLSKALNQVSKFEVLTLLGWVNARKIGSEHGLRTLQLSSQVHDLLQSIESDLKENDLNGPFTDWCLDASVVNST